MPESGETSGAAAGPPPVVALSTIARQWGRIGITGHPGGAEAEVGLERAGLPEREEDID